MLSVTYKPFVLGVIMLSVVMLSVVTPKRGQSITINKLTPTSHFSLVKNKSLTLKRCRLLEIEMKSNTTLLISSFYSAQFYKQFNAVNYVCNKMLGFLFKHYIKALTQWPH